MRKKVLIDIGSNVGDSIRLFKEHLGPFDEIFAFEPNPHHFILYDDFPDVKLNTAAAWTYDGKIKFNIYNDKNMACSGLYQRENMQAEEIEVDCLDISNWLNRNIGYGHAPERKDDYVIMKVDIEGAEFKVIEHLLKNGGLEYVNQLYVEHHKRGRNTARGGGGGDGKGKTGNIIRDEYWEASKLRTQLSSLNFDRLEFSKSDLALLFKNDML